MKIGVYIFSTDYCIGIVELARALEERGYGSLFVPEHTHIPTSRRSPWPGGAELPREYSHTLDPLVGLAAAATATEKLRLGTGIVLLTERDPIVTAKAVATLDLISNGRVDFGIGAGWNAEEMENHGTVFDTRFRVMVDRAKAMQAIWTQDEAAYKGEFTEFDAIWSWPKPVQKPHPLDPPRAQLCRSASGDGAARALCRRGRPRHEHDFHHLVRREPGCGLSGKILKPRRSVNEGRIVYHQPTFPGNGHGESAGRANRHGPCSPRQ
jgi:hypothetical protein